MLWFSLLAASALFMLPLLIAPLVGSGGGAGAWRSFGLRGESVLALTAAKSEGRTLFYAQTPSGLWRKIDEGTASGSWVRIDTELPHSTLGAPLVHAWQIVSGQPRRMYALAGPADAKEVYLSEDGGDRWRRVGFAPGQSPAPALAVLPGTAGNPDVIMIATTSGLQRSLDGGATWTPGGVWPMRAGTDRARAGTATVDVVRQLLVEASAPDRIVAVSTSGGLWISENSGLSWHIAGLQDYEVAAAAYGGSGLWAASTSGSANELLYSPDSGATWESRPLPVQAASLFLGSTHVVALTAEPAIAEGLYAAVRGGKVYRTVDQGRTWELLGAPGATHIAAVVVHPRVPAMIYAATDDGIWTRPVAPIVPTPAPTATIAFSSTPEPSATPATPTVTASHTPAPTATASLTPTSTSTATSTLTSTATATATRLPATATRLPSPTARPRQVTPTELPVVPSSTPPNVAPPPAPPTGVAPPADTPTAVPAGPTATPTLPR